MDSTNTNVLSALSTQMADAVDRIGPALVQVNGRPRQAATGVVYAPELILTADHVVEVEENLTVRTHDGRVVAAARGGRWVAIFDPGTGAVRSTTIGGRVAAVAFDGSAGIVIVATTNPNRVVGLDLRDFATAWSMPLSAAPSAVAMTTERTIVAAGRPSSSRSR